MWLRVVVLLSMFTVSASTTGSVTYYASPTGDDGADGLTPSTAKQTIKPLLASLAAGDSLLLLSGTYDAESQNGTANLFLWIVNASDVTLAAAPGASPRLEWETPDDPDHATFLDLSSGVDRFEMSGIEYVGWWGATNFARFHDFDGLTIRDCRFEAVSPHIDKSVIRVLRGRNVLIDSCEFVERRFGSWYYAVYLEGDGTTDPDSFTVRDCVFNTEADLGDTLGWSAGITVVDGDVVTIEGCSGFNVGNNRDGDEFFSWDFVDLRNADDVLVRDLSLQRYLFDKTESSFLHTSEGVSLGDWFGDPCERVIVTEASLWGAGHGIDVRDFSTDVTITHVWCDSTYDDCVSVTEDCSDIDIRYVVSHYAQDNGIAVHGTDVSIDHCTIVRPNRPAIVLSEDASGVTVRNTIVYDVRNAYPWDPDLIAEIRPTATGWSFDYDLWYDPDSTQVMYRYSGANHTFAEWQGIGMDGSGDFTDPLFMNAGGRAWPIGSLDFALQAASPGVAAADDGFDIGAVGSGGIVSVVAQPDARWFPLRAHPNPLSRSTSIVLAGAGKRVSIFDVAGRRVRTLESRGGSSVRWDGRDDEGRRVGAGVYLLRSTEGIGRVVVAR